MPLTMLVCSSKTILSVSILRYRGLLDSIIFNISFFIFWWSILSGDTVSFFAW
jgi:hypothetical protein